MAGTDSTKAVLLAVLANLFLSVTKLAAFLFSGSGAMLSEAIHSAADTGNQLLLFIGIRRSERPADATFHYGFGAERFFFALMSAAGIFVLGCGVTMYHGIHMLLHPEPPHSGWLNYAVLGLSLVVEGGVLLKALGVVNKERGKTPLLEYLRKSSDPTLAAVLLEDGVACLGVLVAFAGIAIAQSTGNPTADAIATLVIAGLMGFIAVWLGYKNRSLILGQSLPAETQSQVIDFLESQDTVEGVSRAKSIVVGADSFKFSAEIDWNGSALGERLVPWVQDNLPSKGSDALTPFCQEFGERMTQLVADEVNRIEGELRTRHPELIHLDLEDD
ncbi:MAG: cation diffusion facilitator family transporter [bacterium]|nr:cation diffusion facilitator family transporter [bacterium]